MKLTHRGAYTICLVLGIFIGFCSRGLVSSKPSIPDSYTIVEDTEGTSWLVMVVDEETFYRDIYNNWFDHDGKFIPKNPNGIFFEASRLDAEIKRLQHESWKEQQQQAIQTLPN